MNRKDAIARLRYAKKNRRMHWDMLQFTLEQANKATHLRSDRLAGRYVYEKARREYRKAELAYEMACIACRLDQAVLGEISE